MVNSLSHMKEPLLQAQEIANSIGMDAATARLACCGVLHHRWEGSS